MEKERQNYLILDIVRMSNTCKRFELPIDVNFKKLRSLTEHELEEIADTLQYTIDENL